MLTRASGLLLHPTSLPGPHGIGDLGPAAHAFLDDLVAAGQTWWQVLPLVPTGLGNSPYGGTSAFAGNPLLISPELLIRDGVLPATALADRPRMRSTRVDWERATAWKGTLLARAWEHFRVHATPAQRHELAAWASDPRRGWLADWTLFSALKDHHGGGHWVDWPAPVRQRQPAAMASARQALAGSIDFHGFVQWLFARQWDELRAAATARGIRILGDLPIYVAEDCADVWANPDLFTLDASGRPTAISGVPPDYFSRLGQRWGNPLYRWERHIDSGFAWWIARLRRNLELADTVRLDHFRGFAAYWQLPADAPDGRPGHWVKAPGRELFTALATALGGLPLVAEDLGVITPDVVALREAFHLPGMKVLQFAFGSADSDHLPHRHTRDTVVYTGTHDNDTTRGWFDKAGAAERRRALRYLGCDAHDVVWAQIRACLGSVGVLAIIPLQDVLELGSEGRMNTPSQAAGNWGWRCRAGALTAARAARLRAMVEAAERLPCPPAAAQELPAGYPV